MICQLNLEWRRETTFETNQQINQQLNRKTFCKMFSKSIPRKYYICRNDLYNNSQNELGNKSRIISQIVPQID